MCDDQPITVPPLHALCAVLCRFDRALLVALDPSYERELTRLLAGDLVVPSAERPGTYRLTDAARAAILAGMRRDRPMDELAAHALAFAFFAGRLRGTLPDDERCDAEVHCFHHLGELRELHTERREWSIIADCVATARAAGPRLGRHRRLLMLYDGFLAVRTGDRERGAALLAGLLDRADLDADTRIRALHALGQAHYLRARYDRALAAWQEAHDLADETGDRPYQCRTLLNIGQVHSETGDHDLALRLSERSLGLARTLRDRAREAHALWEVGYNAMQLGRWQIARTTIEEAIAHYAALGVVARLANLHWCQGLLHHLLGSEAASEAAYRRALRIAESPQHHDPPLVMDTLWYMGFLFQTQGRLEEALASFDRALGVARRIGNEHALAFIRHRRGDVLRAQGRPGDALAAYRQAIEGLESLRSDTEDEGIKIRLLGTVQQLYEAMVLLCVECGRHAEAFDYVERARSRAFVDTLVRKAPELYGTVAQPIATLAEVQARLPAGALLLEYFTTGVLPRGEHLLNRLPPENTRLRAHLIPPPRTLIFAVTRDRLEVRTAELDPNTLRPQERDPVPGRRLLRARLLATLHERLIAPIGHLLRGRDRLFIIPHGPLHHIPFAALRGATGAPLLAPAGPALAFAPSATILLRNCLGQARRAGGDVLTLGYNGCGARALRYAEVEARRVARLTGGRAWTGCAPKVARLLAAAAGGAQVRWFHFAGHAIFDPGEPLDSALQLGERDLLSARAILDGQEIRAEMVVLSACTSGLSQVVPGDELLGLPRALLYAGTPTVVCTLWEAYDLVTLLVMEHFYAGLRRGRPPAESLRDAQIGVRALTGAGLRATLARWRAEDPALSAALGDLADPPRADDDATPFADPLYWAPFILLGRPD